MVVETGRTFMPIVITPEIREKPPLFQEPGTRTDLPPQEPINPRFLNVDSFKALDGHMQEAVLLSLLRSNDLAKIDELRPDFGVNQPLTKDEIAISFLIEEITKRRSPITVPPSYAPDSLFAQIYSLGYPIEKTDLVEKLEVERGRTKIEFPGYLFAPIDTIGTIAPARRYLANLSMAIEKENAKANGGLKKVYTRDSFKPSDPSPLGEKPTDEQKERFKRTRDAIDAYRAEISLAGVPFS